MQEGKRGIKGSRVVHKKRPNWFILLLTLMIIFFGYTMLEQQMTLRELSKDTQVANERLNNAKAENEALKKENADLRQDNYIERLAREELGMTKGGEIPYIYPEEK